MVAPRDPVARAAMDDPPLEVPVKCPACGAMQWASASADLQECGAAECSAAFNPAAAMADAGEIEVELELVRAGEWDGAPRTTFYRGRLELVEGLRFRFTVTERER